MQEGAHAPRRSEPGSGRLQAIAVALFVVDAVLIGLEKYARGRVEIAELIGAVLAPIIFAILIVWIARLFKRATSPRAAAKVFVGTLAVFAVGSCGGLLTAMSATSATSASSTTSGDARSPARLAEMTAAGAANIHSQQVDSVTRLRRVTAVGDTVVYSYLMFDTTRNELDPSSVDAFRMQLIHRACGNAELRSRLLSHGVVMRYDYADANLRPITTVNVTEDICSESGSGARA
jgi:hypothetical protein